MVALGLVLALAIGLSLGLLGGGGSILSLPVLHYLFGLGVHEAVATSLLIVGTTSALALILHARAGRVRWRVGLAFGAASMAASFAGARAGAWLPGGVLLAGFVLVMVGAGVAMVARSSGAAAAHPQPAGRRASLPRVVAIGAAVGVVTGLLGAGGGFVIVPALTLFGGLAVRDAVGTSLLVIAMSAAAGLAGSDALGHLDGRVGAAVTALAVIGSLAGVAIGRRVAARHLQRGFAVLVLVVALAIALRELA